MTTPPERGFPIEEFAMRARRARERMDALGLAGLLLTTEPEIRYFSGFRTAFWQSPTRPWFLFVPQSGAPVAIVPEIGVEAMRRTWIEDVRSWRAPAPTDDGLSLLIELLGAFAARRETIGVPKGHETHLRMPLGDWERLIRALPGLEIADATGLVAGLRMVKSEREIEKIAHACAIGSRAFARLPDIACEGAPLEEVFREFRREVLAQGADDAPYLVGGADQGGYRDVISPPSLRPLRRGDVLMLDLGAVWDGYYCDFDRNWAIGEADDASLGAYEALRRSIDAGLAAARPGVACHELCEAMRAPLGESASGSEIGRLGHGLGMQLTEWPSIAPWDETRIEENATLTLEPSIGYGNGKIMALEENVVVRASGARLLTERAPARLPALAGR